MSKVAYADMVVPRKLLKQPGVKRDTRIELYGALSRLGHVEKGIRYVQDPPDGPFHDGTYPEPNGDEYAVVRIVGRVVPFKGSGQ
jgi:hypothetical protein